MIYRKSITTAANTAEADKQAATFKICKGIIHQIDIVFPPGCGGKLHLAINHGLHQVWPINPDENFASSGETISFEEYIEVNYEPFELTVYTWNLSTTYSHEVIIRLGVKRPGETIPMSLYWEE